ncbi:hypothetical protein lerEdw1_005607 [Lerista edwardsae]|nr:hypothetical protein lerEdw1_005607 [Lerista edwardsae]
MPLSGQVCVVTGASRGIGKGIALQLSEAGATVYITSRHRESLERAAAEVRGRGGKCVPVVCDSSREEEVAALFERVRQEQAGRLDVLVRSEQTLTVLADLPHSTPSRGPDLVRQYRFKDVDGKEVLDYISLRNLSDLMPHLSGSFLSSSESPSGRLPSMLAGSLYIHL